MLLRCYYGVLLRGVTMGCYYGVLLWGINIGCYYGVLLWGINIGCYYGVLLWGVTYTYQEVRNQLRIVGITKWRVAVCVDSSVCMSVFP